VLVIKSTLPSDREIGILKSQIEHETEEAAKADAETKIWEDKAKAEGYEGTKKVELGFAEESRRSAAAHRDDVSSMRTVIQALSGEEDTAEAWKTCHLFAPRYSFGPTARTITVAEGKTGIDGKYQIPNVPGGSYYLYAEIDTPTLSATWLIPIKISGNDLAIDLDNDNAVYLHGS
jgi:hypothetical protein